MLRINDADKFFNKYKKNKIHVINHTSLDVGSNGLVALLGPSGCGKTTLLNAIGGLDKIEKGTIFVNNEKISSKLMYKVDKIRNLNIGYIFQDYKLIDDLSVFDNVAFVLKMLGIKNKKEIEEKVLYVLDCVGMLRYKRRPASMLSGGERQRVGIARALVKDPNIILADEPTGNLDSKNSLEIMKIIKSISEKRLVILVTHEQNLARFYATRIIEIEDGTIVRDYANDNVEDLDYVMDNCFYLKDFTNKFTLNDMYNKINIYTNTNERVYLDIVLKNGNIYIKGNGSKKIEVVGEDDSIEFIDGSYEKLSHDKIDNYNFDFNKIKNIHGKKYTSIINVFSMITEGFKKVFGYSILKKILLAGFFAAGMFIMYSVSSYMASLQINEKDFIMMDRNYLRVESAKLNLDDYLKSEANDNIIYVIPGNSIASISVPLGDYYQTSGINLEMTVSIVSTEVLDESSLIMGEMPANSNEVVLDKLAINRALDADSSYKMAGIIDYSYMLGRMVTVSEKEYKVVGISDVESPNFYVNSSELIRVVSSTNRDKSKLKDDSTNVTVDNLKSYNEYKDKLEIKKGRAPLGDYEVIVSLDSQEAMPLNKEINVKVNGKRLVVVGYYTSKYDLSGMYTNDNTIKYLVVIGSRSYTIMPRYSDVVLEEYMGNNINIIDTYESSKSDYLKSKKAQEGTTVVVSGIILVISFVEIFLMIRSSFLSRIKEVGIYRAIGVKRLDICKMFVGEIFAITTIAGLPGIILMAYFLRVASKIKYLSNYILINYGVVLLAIIIIYVFNIIIGLLPVINTIRKRPAEILARYDLD